MRIYDIINELKRHHKDILKLLRKYTAVIAINDKFYIRKVENILIEKDGLQLRCIFESFVTEEQGVCYTLYVHDNYVERIFERQVDVAFAPGDIINADYTVAFSLAETPC